MAYVDLNPVRAKMADTPETSDHTSVQKRIASAKKSQQPTELFPFVGNPRDAMPEGLPFQLSDYLALVDWTGRAIREDKRGFIDEQLPPILARLNISHKHWQRLTQQFEKQFRCFAGQKSSFEKVRGCFQLNRTPPNLFAC